MKSILSGRASVIGLVLALCGPVSVANAQARSLTQAEIAQYAPILYLHPGELYRPMDPVDFIRRSRFRHEMRWARDRGYNKHKRKWVKTNSKSSAYYDIPVWIINAYRQHKNGKNRRPRDKHNGRSYNVFLQPRGKPRGSSRPNGRVPVFYTYRRFGQWHKIQFWWFFGFNQTPVPFIGHQGDWEHITVWAKHGRPQYVFFAAHNGGTRYKASQITLVGKRPVVFVAWGTHASYPRSGVQSYPLKWKLRFVDFTGHGYRWMTHLKLLPLSRQPWKDYAGAWGEVGLRDMTTGPLGPWHKRDKK